jgi:hypothetical protein
MALQKVRKLALQRLFKTSTYNLYAFTIEHPLRLGVQNFYLAILFFLQDHQNYNFIGTIAKYNRSRKI